MFTPRENRKTLPFCQKLMTKAEGFTSRFDFSMHVAFARSLGTRKRKPPVLRRRALDALLQGLCFHYDPLAIECGLATESDSGNLSITCATRALHFLAELGLITYQTEYDAQTGCHLPTDITFTRALFAALDVSENAILAARRSRVEWENKQRKQQGLEALETDQLIAKAWRYVRERFRTWCSQRREHGLKRRQARRDQDRSRKDIESRVRQQVAREMAAGKLEWDLNTLKREVARRVKERMLMSRNAHYTRLATT